MTAFVFALFALALAIDAAPPDVVTPPLGKHAGPTTAYLIAPTWKDS